VSQVWDSARCSSSGRRHAALLSSAQRAEILRELADPSVAPADLMCASDIQPVATHGNAADDATAARALQLWRLGCVTIGGRGGGSAGGREVSSSQMLGAGGQGGGVTFAALLSADGDGGMGVSELTRFATQHGLALTSTADVRMVITSR